jgi:hypothetical protein
MHCSGIEMESGPELLDPAQLLYERSKVDALDPLTDMDVLPKGISDADVVIGIEARELCGGGCVHTRIVKPSSSCVKWKSEKVSLDS